MTNRREFLKRSALGTAGIAIGGIELGTTHSYSATKDVNGKMAIGGKIKIGQIGVCHEHASGYIKALKKNPDIYEIVGVVDDRNSTAAKRAGDDFNPYEGLKWMTEEELFRTPGLQAVTVETPNSDLVPAAIRCMEHNVAIHMDKPGGEDLELFRRLLDGCQERNLPFQMGYMFRTNPAFQFCQKAFQQNWLGNIFEIQVDMSHNYGGEEYQQYLSHFKGGIMFNLGCHHIDFILSMLGRPEKITPFLRSTRGAVNRAKNNCMTVIEYQHTIVSLYACDLKTDGINQRRLKMSGSKGSLELSPLERFDGKPLLMQMVLSEGNEEYTAGTHVLDFGIMNDRYEGQLHELAQMIRGEIKNPYSYEHDYLTQEVLMAAAGYTQWNYFKS